ncbi:hypothetical protein CRG98_004403 [Punica granatum]|uniref:Uncharacterized protein n=1 Tax=Punica granatum TaxID=22663 RepID=A0A2I0L393_PUNGR|nr:hypothetical protein CRG98_004403 [Punica granatum]
MSFQQVTRNSGYTSSRVHPSPHACHFLLRLRRVVLSHLKGFSQPSLSPMKRRSWSESRSSTHNLCFALFSLPGFDGFYQLFSHRFRACLGSCTLEACHQYIDMSLRSLRNLTSLDAMIGAVVPTTFPPSCRGRCSQVTPNTGSNTPHTLNARNPSVEWDLTSSHQHARSMAYVEGDLDRMCESRLDITRELDRSNGYNENQSILLSP